MQCSKPARCSTSPPASTLDRSGYDAFGLTVHFYERRDVPAGTWGEPFRLMGCTAGSAKCVVHIGRLLPRSPIMRRLMSTAKTTLLPAEAPRLGLNPSERFAPRRSLLQPIFGETTSRASRTYASRTPASPVLRILDPRLALAIFAAKSQSRDIDQPRRPRRWLKRQRAAMKTRRISWDESA